MTSFPTNTTLLNHSGIENQEVLKVFRDDYIRDYFKRSTTAYDTMYLIKNSYLYPVQEAIYELYKEYDIVLREMEDRMDVVF